MASESASDSRPHAARAGSARGRGLRSPDVVAIAAILVPGLGHLLLGRFRAALVWLVLILAGHWAVFFPGVILHAISVGAVYRTARRRLAQAEASAGAAGFVDALRPAKASRAPGARDGAGL